jgi:hypothetical protein
MKSGFFVFASTVLLANGTIFESVMLEGGALMILGWTVWYIFARHLPAERKSHVAENREARKEFREALDSLVEAINRLADTEE